MRTVFEKKAAVLCLLFFGLMQLQAAQAQNAHLTNNTYGISKPQEQRQKHLYVSPNVGFCIPTGNAFENQNDGLGISGNVGVFLTRKVSIELGYSQSWHSAYSDVNEILDHSRMQGFSIGLKRWGVSSKKLHSNEEIFLSGGISFSKIKWRYQDDFSSDDDEINVKSVFFTLGFQRAFSKLISAGISFTFSYSLSHDKTLGRYVEVTEYLYDENNMRYGVRTTELYDWSTSGSIYSYFPTIYICFSL